MAIAFITVNGEKIPLPSSSSGIWHNRDVITDTRGSETSTRIVDPQLFQPLLERIGVYEDGQPNLILSDKVVVRYDVLEQNEASNEQRDPVFSAYKKYVDEHPGKFIKSASLDKEPNASNRRYSILLAQWVVFTQRKGSPEQPRLCAYGNAQSGQIYLPGMPISQPKQLDSVHKQFLVTRKSKFVGMLMQEVVGEFQMVGDETVIPRLRLGKLRRSDIREDFILEPQRVEDLGIEAKGLRFKDDTGTVIELPGTVYEVPGVIQLARFGLVYVNNNTDAVTHLNSNAYGHIHVHLTTTDCRADKSDLSPQIQEITGCLFRSGAWEQGAAATAKRVLRWAARQAYSVIKPGHGD
jgi:hypothetical protein